MQFSARRRTRGGHLACTLRVHTRRATRFHAVPLECHGAVERYGEFRFHYDPLKRARKVRRLVNISLRQWSANDRSLFRSTLSRVTYAISQRETRG